MKKCRVCKNTMLKKSFHVSRRNSDGLEGMCKECRKEYNNQYSLKNREKISIRQADWYKKRKNETT